jgi:hypothetical protein
VILYYHITIPCNPRYLQGISGFENLDSHGLLSIRRPKFLHQDTKTISLKQWRLDTYSSKWKYANLMDFRSLPVTSDFKKHDLYGIISLVSALTHSVIHKKYRKMKNNQGLYHTLFFIEKVDIDLKTVFILFSYKSKQL